MDWDFSVWHPNVVVINLGTNDNLNAQNPGDLEASYVSTYINFVTNILSSYASHPPSAVFLACGPMTDSYCNYVFEVIEELNSMIDNSVSKVYFLDQRNVLDSTNQCCGHPDKNADITLSSITTSAIQSVMHWN
jgi:hypothetical protein